MTMGGDGSQLGGPPPGWFQQLGQCPAYLQQPQQLGQCNQQLMQNAYPPYQLQGMQQAAGMQAAGWVEDYGEGSNRARLLLHRHLTEEQDWTLDHFGYFDVKGQIARPALRRWWSWNRYRGAEPHWHTYRLYGDGSVHEMDGDRRLTAFCIVVHHNAMERLPLWDRLLALKLMIESDLPEFLKTAKVMCQFP